MLTICIQKIKKQKWLSFCLLLGVTLLIAVFCSQPMFENGSLDKMLENMFDNSIAFNNQYPVVLRHDGVYTLKDTQSFNEVTQTVQANEAIWLKNLDYISVINKQSYYQIESMLSLASYYDRYQYFTYTCMPGFEDHINILHGQKLSEYSGDLIPCLVSEKSMDYNSFILGEEIMLENYKNRSGDKARFIVVGIFDVADREDSFWYHTPLEDQKEVYISTEAFDKLCTDYGIIEVNAHEAVIMDHESIKNSNIDAMNMAIGVFKKMDSMFSVSFDDMFKSFFEKRQSTGVMLWVLEIPILVMLLAFIYMVSGQIASSQSGEIAMQRSRGFSKFQVVKLYFLQTLIIVFIGCILGVPAGYGLCKLAASTTDFLTFSSQDISMYVFIPTMLIFAGIAGAIGLVIILLPVFGKLSISIVQQKSSYKFVKRMFWEKYFLDVILLAVSLYLLYNYNKSIDSLRVSALAGGKMDPVIFINTCAFMVSLGLLVFRLIHYLVNIIYKLGLKKWKLVSYVSFLQISRTFTNQCFIAVFMILTVSMGLFDANVARTINQNKEDRIVYSNGADIITSEKWLYHDFKNSNLENKMMRRYIEPDFTHFETLKDEGLIDNLTKVIRYKNTTVAKQKMKLENCVLYGIDTKRFGETADLKNELNTDKHWFNQLNDLAVAGNGVIISRNLADSLEVGLGDAIALNGYSLGKVDEDKKMNFKVVDIIDNFPGYDRYYYEEGQLKERYLAVINYATLVQNFELYPYEVWMRLNENATPEMVYQRLLEMNLDLTEYKAIPKLVSDMKSSPDIQIINGMFTLSFIISLVLCGVGFLIYWVASIQSRELLFGVYRAMGLAVKNVNKMLSLEHFFSTFLSVLAGGGVGMAVTMLFIQLFSVAYLPEKSNLELYIYYEASDIIKLFATIFIMIIICLFILKKQVKNQSITQALKKGED